MKTVCSFDNVACLVDNFPQSIDQITLVFVSILGAVVFSVLIATLAKGN